LALPTERHPARRTGWQLFLFIVLSSRLPAAAPAGLDSTRTDSLPSPNPRSALIRSAVLPGWGQYYNQRPLKAVFFAGTATGLLSTVIAEQRDLNQLSEKLADLRREDPSSARIDALERASQDQAGKRNTRLLYLVLAVTFSALDAYVDAHLADFDAVAETGEIQLRPGGALLRLKAVW